MRFLSQKKVKNVYSNTAAWVLLCNCGWRWLCQWTVLPLADNFEEDEFEYLIHVHTGFKMSSGTKSNVFFRLNGTDGETGVRKMADGVRQVTIKCHLQFEIIYLFILCVQCFDTVGWASEEHSACKNWVTSTYKNNKTVNKRIYYEKVTNASKHW